MPYRNPTRPRLTPAMLKRLNVAWHRRDDPAGELAASERFKAYCASRGVEPTRKRARKQLSRQGPFVESRWATTAEERP